MRPVRVLFLFIAALCAAERALPFAIHGFEFTGGEFVGAANVRLHYRNAQCPQAHATVVVLPGYSESALKYDEVAVDLCAAGFEAWTLDHRGQGDSERLTAKTPMAVIDDYRYLREDTAQFIDHFVPKGRPRFLLAHSMGGMVGSLVLEARPGLFRAATLSAPMLEIRLPILGEPLTRLLLGALAWLRGRDSYLPGQGPQRLETERFETNKVTSDRQRFERNTMLLREHPELIVGQPSVGWLQEALAGAREAREQGARAIDPVLILQADNDAFVHAEGQASFCALAKACEQRLIKGAKHEILQERDELRKPALAAAIQFFEKNRAIDRR